MKKTTHKGRCHAIANEFPSVSFVWRVETGWPSEYVSENVVDLLGHTAEDFTQGRVSYVDLVFPEDRARVLDEIQRGMAAGGPDPWEHLPYRLQNRAGNWIWVQDKTRFVPASEGSCGRLEGTIVDVTRTVELLRKLDVGAKEPTQRTEAGTAGSLRLMEIENVVSSSSDMLVLLGREREVRYANTAFLRTFDLLETFVPGAALAGLPGAEAWIEEVTGNWDSAMKGESKEWTSWGPLPHAGMQFLYLSLRPHLSSNGDIAGAVLVLRNQTEQQVQTQSLRRLEKAIEQVSESIVITDAHGVIEYVNPFFERTTGYSRQEVLGKSPGILRSGSVPDSFYQDLWDTIRSGRTWNGRFINRRKTGELFTEDASISPIADPDGTVTHFVAVKRDVSDEVALTQQLQLSEQFESRSQVYRNMLHEINDHLAVILGHAELLGDFAVRGQVRPESVSLIRDRTRAMSSLIHAAMAREARPESVLAGCDLAAVAHQSIDILKRILPENIAFTSYIADRKLPVLSGAQDVDLMITNLLLNAEDAIEEDGHISIRVDRAGWLPDTLRRPGDASPFAMIEVTDDGRGLDDFMKAHMFDQFFTTRDNTSSTGLGLWGVKQLLDSVGGEVEVESAPGKGTRMILWIPMEPGETAEYGVPETGATLAGMSVMVVDDDPAYLRLTTAMLTLEETTVYSFSDSASAMAWLRTRSDSPDLLMADHQLPESTGLDLVRAARALFPDLDAIVFSGHTEASACGEEQVRILRKPFDASDLHDSLMRVRSRQTLLTS